MLNEIEYQSGRPAKNDHPVCRLYRGQGPPVPTQHDIAVAQRGESHHGEIERGLQIGQLGERRAVQVDQCPQPDLDDDGEKHPDGQAPDQESLVKMPSWMTEARQARSNIASASELI